MSIPNQQPTRAPQRASAPELDAVTGVQLMQGVGIQPARGFWADAWSTVMKRRMAVIALGWISIVATLAVFSPVLANGHPLMMTELGDDGQASRTTFPLINNLSGIDLFLLLWGVLASAWVAAGWRSSRARRVQVWFAGLILGVVVVALGGTIHTLTDTRDASPFMRSLSRDSLGGVKVGLAASAVVMAVLMALPLQSSRRVRFLRAGAACVLGIVSLGLSWNRPNELFNYQQREVAGEITAKYTVVPWSPGQRYSELSRKEPGTTLGDGLGLAPETPSASRRFILGTDAFGTDVLSQLMHACRLSISIGIVSTGIALLIGVTMGALMGYFGGWVDLLLYRVVEIFMAVPVLFLLIVAVSVLPTEMRSTYMLMAIIGCFTWTGMARFTRAEFMKLRTQDFVQSAKSVGLPLRSVLFKHMLPNGVAPVLVDTSFAVAAAITVEAVLSYLSLGPIDQASWGRLLSSATNSEGQFKWWLAVFPGAAIFLTVLSYNLLGEALRDAIDPKLKKARV